MSWLKSVSETEGTLRVYLHIARRWDLITRAGLHLRHLTFLQKGYIGDRLMTFLPSQTPFNPRSTNRIGEPGADLLSEDELCDIYSSIHSNVIGAVQDLRINLRRRVRPRVTYQDVRYLIAQGIRSHFDYEPRSPEYVALRTPQGHLYPLRVRQVSSDVCEIAN